MKRKIYIILAFVLFCVGMVLGDGGRPVFAASKSQLQKEYTSVLSQAIRDGVSKKNMDRYKTVSQGISGQNCLRDAVISNRTALMAEDIDALDTNWKQYYAVSTSGQHTTFISTKLINRKLYKKRYKKISQGLSEVLSCIDPTMSDADKAVAVYKYLSENTNYQTTEGAHTGYDVFANHTGVCDGFSNAYALVMNTLDIPCVVVSNYAKDHSWNMVKIGNVWYFVDLTFGIGSGRHEGTVVTYSNCLIGIETFMRTHGEYSVSDVYGQGNSDDLNIKSLNIAKSDYIGERTGIGSGISQRTCMFYHNGYWYWISTGNSIKRSKLNGSSSSTVFTPSNHQNVGWIYEYSEKVYLSLDDTIYSMDYSGMNLKKIYQVDASEYHKEVTSFFWQLAFIGRFIVTDSGKMSYYVTDLQGARKGNQMLSVTSEDSTEKPIMSKSKVVIGAGYSDQLYLINTEKKNAASIRWSSSNRAIVKVDQYGCITAKKAGNAKITATIGTRKVQCSVKVTGYTITYRNEGVNAAGNVAMATGKSPVALKSPKKKGYTFKGWYLDRTCRRRVKKIKKGNKNNITVYAKWVKNK